MAPTNFVTRKGSFDAAHRILHERFKCFNLHGHEYHYELTFSWNTPTDLGYAIDFREIRRIVGDWIEEHLDHAFIANPQDQEFIRPCQQNGLKLYLMHPTDPHGYCNPTAENIAKEIFFAGKMLLETSDLKMHAVRLWETTNCYVDCTGLTSDEIERLAHSPLAQTVSAWRDRCGILEYDRRRV